jgi:hypothetical protein
MPISTVIAPIAEGRLDEWREFHAELTGGRSGEWAESHRRRGITREIVFLWTGSGGPAAVYVVEGSEDGLALEFLAGSGNRFDEWLNGRLADLHGDLDFPARLSDTRPPDGAWRGWRGLMARLRRN